MAEESTMSVSQVISQYATVSVRLPNTALLSFFLLGSPFLVQAAVGYSVRTLSALGTSAGTVSAINGSGLTVGFVTNAQGNQLPVFFNEGQAHPLGAYGQVNGVNAAGDMIGTAYLKNTPFVTEWSNKQAISLGFSGYGVAINNAGQVAGGYETSKGLLRAFIWNSGTLVDLGTLGGTWSTANGINSRGQVVGTSTTISGSFHAFFSDVSTNLVDIGTLGGISSYGMAINRACEIVGTAQTSQGLMNAFLWKKGKLIDLGTLGGAQSYAYAINDAGTVVGSSWVTGNLVTHAFIHSGGVMIDLNRLLLANSGWTINAAYGINDSGEIVGTGTLSGRIYAVKLVPDSSFIAPKAP
jgi:probable HAF family extracellular repeat protein